VALSSGRTFSRRVHSYGLDLQVQYLLDIPMSRASSFRASASVLPESRSPRDNHHWEPTVVQQTPQEGSSENLEWKALSLPSK